MWGSVYCPLDFYISAGKIYELEKCLLHMSVKDLNIQKVCNYYLVIIIVFYNVFS